MKIYAPVKDFDGWRNNVRFVRGVGETDDPQLIEWFLGRGYTVENNATMISGYISVVEDVPVDVPESTTTVASTEPDFENMTPNDLRDWMREHGYGSKIKNTRSKEKLLEILRG